jgi:hypothetical protein
LRHYVGKTHHKKIRAGGVAQEVRSPTPIPPKKQPNKKTLRKNRHK